MRAYWEVDDDMEAAWEEPLPPGVKGCDALPPGGWYELKYVRTFGPYLYFRYRDGNVRRAVYLGKANAEVVAWVKVHQRRPRHVRPRGRIIRPRRRPGFW